MEKRALLQKLEQHPTAPAADLARSQVNAVDRLSVRRTHATGVPGQITERPVRLTAAAPRALRPKAASLAG
ncbi:hypothetical protein ACFWIB_35875 [Streptomyces sp. NPDC127051]|uniref:hypothetical protein n=1 Tax=Streptomyces sp. NPDC127051 TaxID=3347119 RepID=UPI0036619EE9